MNVALILAGGIGTRSEQTIPKQFIEICGMPVIAHTMHAFQTHPEIDAICVVCLDGWHDKLIEIAKKYNITKLKHVASGGTSNQESIFNGLSKIRGQYSDDTIIVLHDAVRPIVSHKIISDCILTTKKYGNAFAAIPCYEPILVTVNNQTAQHSIKRDTLRRIQTPNGCKLGNLWTCHLRANATRTPPFTSTCNLLLAMDETIHLCEGDRTNIKLTIPEDFDILRTLLAHKQCTNQH